MKLPASIPYIILCVTMRAESYCSLPEWIDSTIRGALGTELHAEFCRYNEYRCENCENKCSAGLLFSTAPQGKSEESVNPYIVSEGRLDDDILTFRITLFSKGTEAVSDVVSVLKKGLKLGVRRIPFKLVSVTDYLSSEYIFDGVIFTEPVIHELCPEEEKASRIRVDFITPYKSKIQSDKFGFEQLMRAALRRVSTVYRQSGNEPDFDYKSMLEKASVVKNTEKNLSKKTTQRYSNRTASKMDVTGFTGYSVYCGDLTEFIPLLRIAEVIHAGKMCVMGLGEIRVTVLE